MPNGGKAIASSILSETSGQLSGCTQFSNHLDTIFCWVVERIFGSQLSVLFLVVEVVAAVGMEQLEDDETPTLRRME